MIGMYFSMYSRFSCSRLRRCPLRMWVASLRPHSWRPSLTSLMISGYEAMASLDSEVKGTHTEAMWPRTAMGATGKAPRGWDRP